MQFPYTSHAVFSLLVVGPPVVGPSTVHNYSTDAFPHICNYPWDIPLLHWLWSCWSTSYWPTRRCTTIQECALRKPPVCIWIYPLHQVALTPLPALSRLPNFLRSENYLSCGAVSLFQLRLRPLRSRLWYGRAMVGSGRCQHQSHTSPSLN